MRPRRLSRSLAALSLAALSLAALGLVAQGACAPETEDTGVSLSEDGASIAIDERWKACEADSDCARVSTSCDDCCGQDAVAVTREAEYVDAAAELCASYEGGVCDCAPLPSDVACVDSLCALVPTEG